MNACIYKCLLMYNKIPTYWTLIPYILCVCTNGYWMLYVNMYVWIDALLNFVWLLWYLCGYVWVLIADVVWSCRTQSWLYLCCTYLATTYRSVLMVESWTSARNAAYIYIFVRIYTSTYTRMYLYIIRSIPLPLFPDVKHFLRNDAKWCS